MFKQHNTVQFLLTEWRKHLLTNSFVMIFTKYLKVKKNKARCTISFCINFESNFILTEKLLKINMDIDLLYYVSFKTNFWNIKNTDDVLETVTIYTENLTFLCNLLMSMSLMIQ